MRAFYELPPAPTGARATKRFDTGFVWILSVAQSIDNSGGAVAAGVTLDCNFKGGQASIMDCTPFNQVAPGNQNDVFIQIGDQDRVDANGNIHGPLPDVILPTPLEISYGQSGGDAATTYGDLRLLVELLP